MDSPLENGDRLAENDPARVPRETPPGLENVVALAVLFEGGLVLAALGLGWFCDYWPLRTWK